MGMRFVLIGTSNDGFWHKYSIERVKRFRDVFISFMARLDFEEKEIRKRFQMSYRSEIESDEDIYAEWTVDADEITDEVWHFQNEKYDVDSFFGDEKVFVIVRTKARDEMIKALEKFVEWKSDEEFEEIRKKNGKKLRRRALKEISKNSSKRVAAEVVS